MGAYEDDAVPVAARREAADRGSRLRGNAGLGRVPGRAAAGGQLGARVAPGPDPEVGVLPVGRTAAGALGSGVFGCCRMRFEALQWHADTFELPDGRRATRTVGRPTEQQAFVVNRAYGMQFHIEVGTSLATEWGAVPAYASSLEGLMGAGALPRRAARADRGGRGRDDEPRPPAVRPVVGNGRSARARRRGTQRRRGSDQLGVALSRTPVGQHEHVLEADAHLVSLRRSRPVSPPTSARRTRARAVEPLAELPPRSHAPRRPRPRPRPAPGDP